MNRLSPPVLKLFLFLCLLGVQQVYGIENVKVESKLELPPDAKFTNDLAQGGLNCDFPGVRLECEGFDITCNNQALQLAGESITRINIRVAAWEAFKGMVEIGKDILKAMYPKIDKVAELVDVITRTLDSKDFGDWMEKMAGYTAEQIAG